ncbi:unnamed protein product [Strongylus vulgaris]|uniref:Uncharacterized protein n=1 Tax=Strongylus vulgaris TaxID=40348 RepID=A0A3P7I1Z3_STRVU|nr:unnamed protein product [Strongylus vulgaris]
MLLRDDFFVAPGQSENFHVFGFPNAQSKPCQKRHRLADLVARWFPDPHRSAIACGESMADPGKTLKITPLASNVINASVRLRGIMVESKARQRLAMEVVTHSAPLTPGRSTPIFTLIVKLQGA